MTATMITLVPKLQAWLYDGTNFAEIFDQLPDPLPANGPANSTSVEEVGDQIVITFHWTGYGDYTSFVEIGQYLLLIDTASDHQVRPLSAADLDKNYSAVTPA
jgi:hypothetical protein